LSRDRLHSSRKSGNPSLSDEPRFPGLAAASRQIAGKRAPTFDLRRA